MILRFFPQFLRRKRPTDGRMRTVSAILFILATLGMAQQAIASQQLPRREGRLPNGVRYLIVADRTVANKVDATLYINAGSADDPPGRSELAHIVEHLVINYGTDANGKPGYRFDISSGWGPDKRSSGRGDAATWPYQTYYEYNVHRDFLSPALIQLRQIAQGQQFDQAAFSKSVMDVLGENSSNDNGEVAARAAFRNRFSSGSPSPYSFIDGPRAANFPDARRFYRRHYHAGNIILIISGDLDIAETEHQIAKIFSDVRRGATTTSLGIFRSPKKIEMFSAAYFDRAFFYIEMPTPRAFSNRWNVRVLAGHILRKRFEQSAKRGQGNIRESYVITDPVILGQEIMVEATQARILERAAGALDVLQSLKAPPTQAEMEAGAAAVRASANRSGVKWIRDEYLRRVSPRSSDGTYYGDIDTEMPSVRDVGNFLRQSLDLQNLKLFLAQGTQIPSISAEEVSKILRPRAVTRRTSAAEGERKLLTFGVRSPADARLLADPVRRRFESRSPDGKSLVVELSLRNSIGSNSADLKYAMSLNNYLSSSDSLPYSQSCGVERGSFMVRFDIEPGTTKLIFRSRNLDRDGLWKNIDNFLARCAVDVGGIVADIEQAPWVYAPSDWAVLRLTQELAVSGARIDGSENPIFEPYELWPRLFGEIARADNRAEFASRSPGEESIFDRFQSRRVILPRAAPFGSVIGLTYLGKLEGVPTSYGNIREIETTINRIVHQRARHDHGGVYSLISRITVDQKLGVFKLFFETKAAPEYVEHAIAAIQEELSRLGREVAQAKGDDSPFYRDPAAVPNTGTVNDSPEHSARRLITAKALFASLDLSRRHEIVMKTTE